MMVSEYKVNEILFAKQGITVMRVWPGSPEPLGATWDGGGVNFALFSEHATQVELCLFSSNGETVETHRIALPERTDMVWHGYLPDIYPGQLYGFRVYGPFAPKEGQRFNPNKVLIDPYAKAVGKPLTWDDALFGYSIGGPKKDLAPSDSDSGKVAPLGMVIDTAFTWGDDRPPRTPWHKTIIYELHVKGFTKTHPEIPTKYQGTYLGLSNEATIRYLKELGVTAVELMPVHHPIEDRHLLEKGLTNYWGYNSLSYFAPNTQYASAKDGLSSVREFKMMVRTLHRAGIEVILDVVYNHTAEGNHMGPTLSFRGIDNASYYRLTKDKRYYEDFTGCGNTLNMQEPRVLQLIMDSLRYWVTEMHVDGFRFDLASALARELYTVDRLSAFFDIIRQDPILSRVKLIAEPWDLGEGGYQVGNFPVGWTEWNGKYRDTVRKFWRGDGDTVAEFATRLCGSSDLYEQSGRRPYASINFVTCHDGFTLHDLVSYNEKKNEANGENSQDGSSNNLSWNCGVEGPTDNPNIIALREKQKRNFITTLLISQGIPMLSHGDEIGRTQQGNNNVYCQDNPLSWMSWELDNKQKSLLEFTKKMIRLRNAHPTLTRRKFFQGRGIRGLDIKDIVWLDPEGKEMDDADWDSGFVRCVGMLLSGEGLDETDEKGDLVKDNSLLIMMNAHDEPIAFKLPKSGDHHAWFCQTDTADPLHIAQTPMPESQKYKLADRSTAIFELKPTNGVS